MTKEKYFKYKMNIFLWFKMLGLITENDIQCSAYKENVRVAVRE